MVGFLLCVFFCCFVVVRVPPVCVFVFSPRVGGRFQSLCLHGLLEQRNLFVDWFYFLNLHSFHKFQSPSSSLFRSHRTKSALPLCATCCSASKYITVSEHVIRACRELQLSGYVFTFSKEVVIFLHKGKLKCSTVHLIIKDLCFI